MEMEMDCNYTDEIVCPHCGYEFQDSYEAEPKEEDIGEMECYECDQTFIAQRIITIKYVTKTNS